MKAGVKPEGGCNLNQRRRRELVRKLVTCTYENFLGQKASAVWTLARLELKQKEYRV
jgi:hypothetical protein